MPSYVVGSGAADTTITSTAKATHNAVRKSYLPLVADFSFYVIRESALSYSLRVRKINLAAARGADNTPLLVPPDAPPLLFSLGTALPFLVSWKSFTSLPDVSTGPGPTPG